MKSNLSKSPLVVTRHRKEQNAGYVNTFAQEDSAFINLQLKFLIKPGHVSNSCITATRRKPRL